jgi:hypothetical protein
MQALLTRPSRHRVRVPQGLFRETMSTAFTRAQAIGLLLWLPAGCRGGPPDARHRTDPAPSASAGIVARAVDLDPNLETFRRVFGFSEPGETFLSDNWVSNETSYLDAASALVAEQGGAYLGVGPEQNYSYIAFSRPDLAILVDLRRDNALLHLLYKAIFETARDRAEFLSLLLGRPLDPTAHSVVMGDAEELMRLVERKPPDEGWLRERHAELIGRIRGYGLDLSPQDFEHLAAIHERFFQRQLELRFELHQRSARVYPTFRSLLGARTADGRGSFLATDQGFEFVRSLMRRHRVVPVVGNVGATEPLGKIAAELRRQGLGVTAFYISNVEQYLIGTPGYHGWLSRLRELPVEDGGVLIRSYLDQGRRHPHQKPNQRTTTLVHSMARFLARTERHRYPSYYALVSDDSLDPTTIHEPK